jgi:hypothetical protein
LFKLENLDVLVLISPIAFPEQNIWFGSVNSV